MDYTKSVGSVNELYCLAKFIELGYECSIPYGDASKYDFVVDDEGVFYRIQCKSCSHPKSSGERDLSAIQISTVSQTTNTQKTTRHSYTKNDIDYFATSFEGKVYVVPVEQCSTSKTLRFAPPKGNQNNYNKAEDYLIEKYFPVKEKFLESKNQFLERMMISSENKKEYKCISCNEVFVTKENTMCPKCAHLNSRKCKRPSREELKNMIRKLPFTQIAKQYEVSDRAIAKWCISENLPSKKREINLYSDEEWKLI